MKKQKTTTEAKLRSLRADLRRKKLTVAELEERLNRKTREFELALGKLEEARRWTVPMADGSAINFRPIVVTKTAFKHETAVMQGLSGLVRRVPVRVTAMIECEGDVMFFEAAKKKAGE